MVRQQFSFAKGFNSTRNIGIRFLRVNFKFYLWRTGKS